MSAFKSKREKHLWLGALMVVIVIFLSLFLGRPFVDLLSNQDVQAAFFLLGMLAVGAVIIAYGLINKPKFIETVLVVGIAAVYIMLFLRLGLAERSHLIEYSVLALLIHQAIIERKNQGATIKFIFFQALLITSAVGLIDELLQIFIPDRVFDTDDIIFNCSAIIFALAISSALRFVKAKLKKVANR